MTYNATTKTFMAALHNYHCDSQKKQNLMEQCHNPMKGEKQSFNNFSSVTQKSTSSQIGLTD
jgi:transposase-like protein